MKLGLRLFFFCVFSQFLFGNIVTAEPITRSAKPTAEQYKQCGVLVYNAHSLFESPQDIMGTLVNSAKLFEKWQEMLGFSNEETLENVKPLIQNSFQEFNSKEKFHAAYSKEEQEFCSDLLKAEANNK